MTKRDQIYLEVRSLFRSRDAHKYGACVDWAICGLTVLKRHGYAAVLQAGDLQWPFVDEDQDDLVSASHFGYIWSPGDIRSQVAMACGRMPEFHCWIGLLDEQQIVDFSTSGIKEQAQLIGFTWKSQVNPPLYVWGRLPKGVVYRPLKEATLFVHKVIVEYAS